MIIREPLKSGACADCIHCNSKVCDGNYVNGCLRRQMCSDIRVCLNYYRREKIVGLQYLKEVKF